MPKQKLIRSRRRIRPNFFVSKESFKFRPEKLAKILHNSFRHFFWIWSQSWHAWDGEQRVVRPHITQHFIALTSNAPIFRISQHLRAPRNWQFLRPARGRENSRYLGQLPPQEKKGWKASKKALSALFGTYIFRWAEWSAQSNRHFVPASSLLPFLRIPSGLWPPNCIELQS